MYSKVIVIIVRVCCWKVAYFLNIVTHWLVIRLSNNHNYEYQLIMLLYHIVRSSTLTTPLSPYSLYYMNCISSLLFPTTSPLLLPSQNRLPVGLHHSLRLISQRRVAQKIFHLLPTPSAQDVIQHIPRWSAGRHKHVARIAALVASSHVRVSIIANMH